MGADLPTWSLRRAQPTPEAVGVAARLPWDSIGCGRQGRGDLDLLAEIDLRRPGERSNGQVRVASDGRQGRARQPITGVDANSIDVICIIALHRTRCRTILRKKISAKVD